jgi:hypothetical protein
MHSLTETATAAPGSEAQYGRLGPVPDAQPVNAGDPDARLDVVLAESLRSLEHQQALLDSLRSRATLLITAGALVSTLPIAAAPDRLWGAGLWLTGAGLVGVLACTMVICAPWWRWYFRTSARRLLDAVDLGHSLDDMRRHLAADFEGWVDHNERRIRTLQWWFTAGLAFLAIEVSGWTVQLANARGGR